MRRRSFGLAALGLVVLSLLPFLAALNFELVWDDPLLLAQVGKVAERDGAAGLFASDFRLYPERSMGFYRPLTSLTLWSQIEGAWRAGGADALPRAARSLHAGNLFIHALCSVLVWLLLRRVVGEGWPSWLGAAIFAVHPTHVEPAVFIAARTDSLAAAGVVASFLCWLEGRARLGRSRWMWFVAGGILAMLACLAKEQALLLPLALLAWCILSKGKGALGKRHDWLPFWLLGIGVALFLRWQVAHVGFGPKEELAQSGGVAWFFRLGIPALLLYLKLWFIPWPLNSYYTTAQVAVNALSIVALAATVALVVMAHRRGRGREAIAALAFTLIFLLPVLHLAPLHGAAASERFLYLPSVGLATLIALALVSIENARLPRVASRAFAGAFIVACAIISMVATRPWASNATLYARAVQTSPDAPGGHYGLAGVLVKEGRHDEAIKEYEEAIRLNPEYLDAYTLLGMAKSKTGDLDGARQAFERALALEPNRPGAHTNLGVLAMRQGRLEDALGYFRRAAELDPNSPLAHYNLGLAFARAGDTEGAQRELAILDRLDRARAIRLRAELEK